MQTGSLTCKSAMEEALLMLSDRVNVTSRHEGIFMLMLLTMDVDVIEGQICMGSLMLESIGIGKKFPGSIDRAKLILDQARAEMLDASNQFWETLSKERMFIVKSFAASFHGKKGDVMSRFEQRYAEGKDDMPKACFPCLLQVVYPSQARQQVMLDRYVFVCLFAHAVWDGKSN